MSRYLIHESEGYLTQAKTSNRATGITVTVHDTLVCHRVVGLFRSEDMSGGGRSNERQREIARAEALALVARLETLDG